MGDAYFVTRYAKKWVGLQFCDSSSMIVRTGALSSLVGVCWEGSVRPENDEYGCATRQGRPLWLILSCAELAPYALALEAGG